MNNATRSLLVAKTLGKLLLVPVLLSGFGSSLALAQGDQFENDDLPVDASLFAPWDDFQQLRTFHDNGDEDWIRFPVVGERFYEISIKNVADNADPVLDIFGFDANTLERTVDDGISGDGELFSFEAEQDGIYYIRVRNFDADVSGQDVNYTIAIFEPVGDLAGPDLAVEQAVSYTTIHQGVQVDLDLTVTNLGGQLQNNTAEFVQLKFFLGDGMEIIPESAAGCTTDVTIVSCTLFPLQEGGSITQDYSFIASGLGRRSVVSTVAAFEDATFTSLLNDDKFTNNTEEVEYTVIERPGYGLSVRANQLDFQFFDEFIYFLKLETIESDAALGPVDIYLTVAGEDGVPIYITDLNLNISATPVAVLPGWSPVSVPDVEIYRLVLPDTVPTGTYTWSTILNAAGTDVSNPDNHIVKADFVHQLLSN